MSQLRQAMIDAMLVRGFAVRTHRSYLSAVEGLSKYYHCSPKRLSSDEVQRYFLYLVKERHLAPASCRLSLNGIRFLYQEVLQRAFEAKIQIPGGALDAAGQWRAAHSTYLFSDRALSRNFRGRMVSELRRAYQRGELDRITRPGEVDAVLDRLMGVDWVVKTKPWIRKAKLAKIRDLLGQEVDEVVTDESMQAKKSDWPCPKCHQGQMRIRLALSPIRLTGS